MQNFKINDTLSITCEWKKTRTAFKHEAVLLQNGREIDRVKICYINRTWERYDFESVMQKLLDRTNLLTPEEKKAFIDNPENDRASGHLKTIASIAIMGEIFHGGDQKGSNDWKARMLKAGIGDGLIMPDDWDTLSEDEKEARLNGAINQLQ